MFEFFEAVMLVLSRTLELLLIVPKALVYFGGFTTYITSFAGYISEPVYIYIGGLVSISLTLGLLIGIFK